jgi:hypothetical protein
MTEYRLYHGSTGMREVEGKVGTCPFAALTHFGDDLEQSTQHLYRRVCVQGQTRPPVVLLKVQLTFEQALPIRDRGIEHSTQDLCVEALRESEHPRPSAGHGPSGWETTRDWLTRNGYDAISYANEVECGGLTFLNLWPSQAKIVGADRVESIKTIRSWRECAPQDPSDYFGEG